MIASCHCWGRDRKQVRGTCASKGRGINAWGTFGTLEGNKLDYHEGYIFLTFSFRFFLFFFFFLKKKLGLEKSYILSIFLPCYCINLCFLFSFIFFELIYLMLGMGVNLFALDWKLNRINVTSRFVWFSKRKLVWSTNPKLNLLLVCFHLETWLT